MKRILIVGLLAMSVISLSQQRALAWKNCKFGVGLNFESQSGGNSFLWGFYRNGQPPAPEYGSAFPGSDQHMYGSSAAAGPASFAAPAPTKTSAQPSQAPAQTNAYYYGQPNYQTVTYPSYYTMPNYYYPATFYYYGR